MKLPDFENFEPFVSIRRKMNISEIIIMPPPPPPTPHEGDFGELIRKLNNEGIPIVIKDVTILDDETFEYQGQKILLYIPEQWFHPGRPDSQYKYHICHCDVLKKMRGKKKFEQRYVASRKTDGKFRVSLKHLYTREIIEKDKEKTLNVCKICLKQMEESYPDEKDKFSYPSFDLNGFLGTFGTDHTYKPTYSEEGAPENEYTTDWGDISKRYRESVGWKCEGKYHLGDNDFSGNIGFLHVHHKNSIKSDNSESNLEALCAICHKSISGHENMHIRGTSKTKND